MSKLNSKRRQSGVVLVFVLMLLVLLTTMAGSFSQSRRGDATLVHHTKKRIKQDALAEAGFAYAKFMLTQPQPIMRWRSNGRAYSFAFDGHDMEISIQDEGGKFNLNTIGKKRLIYILESLLGVDGQPLSLADAIVNWRGGLGGAEQKGSLVGSGSEVDADLVATKRLFKSLRELTEVKGVDERIYKILSSYFTVQGRQQKVDLVSAPDYVLALLPGSDPAWVQQVLSLRESDPQSVESMLLSPEKMDYVSVTAPQRGQYLSILVSLKPPNGGVVTKRLLISRNVRGVYPAFTDIERIQ